MTLSQKFKLGFRGVIVGDALGNPVQFMHRKDVQKDPVNEMRSGGQFCTPKGTWTDDSSMTVCLAESIGRLKKLNYEDIMKNFWKWFKGNEFTPEAEAFDIGRTTYETMWNYIEKKPIFDCGGRGFKENGNGALMRILPAAFYVYKKFGIDALNPENPNVDEAFEILHKVAALTHGHWISLIACDIYCGLLILMIGGKDFSNKTSKSELLKIVKNQIEKHAEKNIQYAEIKNSTDEFDNYKTYLSFFDRIFSENFKDTNEDDIKSSGYVLDSIEAAIWCFLNGKNFKECVLKAVNLGYDADTIGDITGGIASVYYNAIPREWVADLRGQKIIKDAEDKFCDFLEN